MKTDVQLQQDVLDELRWEPRVEATDIGVEAKNGVVTLAGHVQSYAEKWAAEDTAQRVAGVKGVVVEIDVRLPNASQRSDIQIVEAARNLEPVGLLLNSPRPNLLRFMPALNVTKEEIDQMFDMLEVVLAKIGK